MMTDTIIELREIEKTYRRAGQEVKALQGINLRINRGEYCAIVGRSGSGKSTLMNIIGCLDLPTNGEYLLCGERISDMRQGRLSDIRGRMIGFIFQSFNLLPGLSALENVELPLYYRGVPSGERRKLAKSALERVGLSHRMNHLPGELSGGQQQRVAIARALAPRPQLILADEPTGNLDLNSGEKIINILRKLHDEGSTIVMITHDEGIARSASRRIRISDGLVEGA